MVCVCVSVCYHVFCHRAQQCAQQHIPAASAGHEQSLKMAFSLTMLRLEVMASFAYRESHRRYYRDPELIHSTAQRYKVVQKPNRALNATWNTGIQANAMQRAISFSVMGQYILRFFPYTFQLLRRGGVQRKTSYTHDIVLMRTSYACKEISACAFFGRVNILSTMLHIPKPTSLGFCTLVHSYYAACMLTQSGIATAPRVCTLVLSLH